MPTDEIISRLFLIGDERLGDSKQRPDALLYASEIVTIGMLFALTGGRYRAFYRWVAANDGAWFPSLPEVSRLHRFRRDHDELADRFLAAPTVFTVLDTFGIELLHPRREGRSKQQLGRTGISNGRWIVGATLAWRSNARGAVVDGDWDTANVPDTVFRATGLRYNGQTITRGDLGFRATGEPASNLKGCARGTWSERFTIETDCSWLTELIHAKKMDHRVREHLVARFRSMAALVNCVLRIAGGKRSLLQFVI